MPRKLVALYIIALYLGPSLLFNFGYADSNDLIGTYEGKGIYRIEDMSATKKGSDYKFNGYVHNISNMTSYISDILLEMFNSKDKLIHLIRIGGGIVIESGEKLPYRVIAHDINFSHLDHYVVAILNSNKPTDHGKTHAILYLSNNFMLCQQNIGRVKSMHIKVSGNDFGMDF